MNDNNGVFAYGRLMLSDSILYVGRNSNKFYIVNVRDPSHPQIDSYLATREATIDIAQYGKYVYIAEADAGILIIDISNSKNIIDSIFISISPLRGMCISDNKLLLADAGPFSIYDITDPFKPKFKYKLHLPDGIINAEIKVDKDFAYVSTNSSFNVLNISNPDSGTIEFTDNNTGFGAPLLGPLAVSNGNILLGIDYFGVIVLKNSLITSAETPTIHSSSFELFQNFPNPFNPITEIKYVINNESFVTLKIYDLLGREISTLVNEKKSIGTYLINFNASNLSSGIYFYSINAGNFHQTRKMILIK